MGNTSHSAANIYHITRQVKYNKQRQRQARVTATTGRILLSQGPPPSMTFSWMISLHCSAKLVTIWPWAVQCDMGWDDGMVIPR